MTDSASPTVAEAFPLVKTCTKCGVEKLLVDFSLQREGRFGRRSQCKACRRVSSRTYSRDYYLRPENKDRQRAYKQRPEIKDRDRAYRQLPNYREWQRAYLQQPEVKGRRRAYQRRPEIKEWQRAYNQRLEVKERRRAYWRRRPQVDPVFRLKLNLRVRLRDALKGQSKSARTLELIGCDINFLRRWLEAKFQPGMTWENYGEWHVDHIMPCASFDLSDPVQQRTCFRWTNLQPLWAADNIRKSDNYAP